MLHIIVKHENPAKEKVIVCVSILKLMHSPQSQEAAFEREKRVTRLLQFSSAVRTILGTWQHANHTLRSTIIFFVKKKPNTKNIIAKAKKTSSYENGKIMQK